MEQSRTRRRTRTIYLRLRRAALYRRFLTCQLPPASNVLPITNRCYGRLKICATVNRYDREPACALEEIPVVHPQAATRSGCFAGFSDASPLELAGLL